MKRDDIQSVETPDIYAVAWVLTINPAAKISRVFTPGVGITRFTFELIGPGVRDYVDEYFTKGSERTRLFHLYKQAMMTVKQAMRKAQQDQ